MRIVAGEWKGRRLLAPPYAGTRPTAERVREAVFQILGPYFPGGVFLDLFAGSGLMAFEALSRGMERAVLVETDRRALRSIRENARILGAENRIRIISRPAERAVGLLVAGGPYDFAYVDPPYVFSGDQLASLLALLVDRGAFSPRVRLVVERTTRTVDEDFVSLRQLLGKLSGEVRLRRFGDTAVWFLSTGRPFGDSDVP